MLLQAAAGDSSCEGSTKKNVLQMQAAVHAFAAILGDRSGVARVLGKVSCLNTKTLAQISGLFGKELAEGGSTHPLRGARARARICDTQQHWVVFELDDYADARKVVFLK